MSDLANIRPGADTPLLLNTRDISVIMCQPESPENPERKALSIYNAVQGAPIWLSEAQQGIDPAVVIKSVRKSGINLFEIPITHGNGQSYGTAFVNPDAFIAAITSAPYIPEGKTEPHIGLSLEMAGHGPVGSHALPVRILDALMTQVQTVKTNLVRIDPHVASSQFVEPGYVVFDAARLSTIIPNGYGMDVQLQDGANNMARIDFHLKNKRGQDPFFEKEAYAAALHDRAHRRGLIPTANSAEYEKALAAINARSWKHLDREQYKLKVAFAESLAKVKPDLVKIENAKDPYYTTLHRASSIECRGDTLSVHFNKADPRSHETLIVRFATTKAAATELKRLQPLLCAP